MKKTPSKKKADTKNTGITAEARYSGASKKKTYFIYDMWKDPKTEQQISGNTVFGSIYIPKDMAGNIPETITITLKGNISTAL